MGAVAITKEDEERIHELMHDLGARSKAQVVRTALQTLRDRIEAEKLRAEVLDSVRRCAAADRRENRVLARAGVARRGA